MHSVLQKSMRRSETDMLTGWMATTGNDLQQGFSLAGALKQVKENGRLVFGMMLARGMPWPRPKKPASQKKPTRRKKSAT